MTEDNGVNDSGFNDNMNKSVATISSIQKED